MQRNTKPTSSDTPPPERRGRRRKLAGCILAHTDGRLLTVHNVESDLWGFPKGGLNPGEGHHAAGLRELHEEAGVALDPALISAVFHSQTDRLYFARADFSHLLPENGGCTVDGFEIDAYEWITLDELRARKTSKFTQRFLGKVERIIAISSPIVTKNNNN